VGFIKNKGLLKPFFNHKQNLLMSLFSIHIGVYPDMASFLAISNQNQRRSMKNMITMMNRNAVLLLGLILIILMGSGNKSMAQSFTSSNNGSWTTGSNWSGGTAPPTSGQNNGTNSINHNLSITGNYSFGGSAINIASSKTLTISGTTTLDNFGTNTISGTLTAGSTLSITNGTTTIASGATLNVGSDFSISSGATINVSGTVNITGNASVNSNFNILPGGVVTVGGNVTVLNSTYLTVGTNVNPPSYADLVIKGNLNSQSSGDITINKNGRVALFGNFTTDGSGGAKMTINSGGQIYIDKNITLVTNANDDVVNNNPVSPSVIGFYVNGTVSGTGGGSTVDSNRGTRATMQTNDLAFYNWVAGLSGSPLPITLVSFKISTTDSNSVELIWATASERNFDKFVIEKSRDGLTFQSIGEVKGIGTSSTLQNYSFTDVNPVSGTNYYRLKSVDLDNSFAYSKTIFTSFEGEKKTFSVYPNPSNGEAVNYTSNFEATDGDYIIVIDYLGVQVASVEVGETNTVRFASTLKGGSYIVKYISKDYQKVDRLIIK
jgi:hypothetical protein